MRNITNEYLTMVTGAENIHENVWTNYDNAKEVFLNKLFNGETIIEKEVQVIKDQSEIENSIRESCLISTITESVDYEMKHFLSNLGWVASWEQTEEDKMKQKTKYMYYNVISSPYYLAKQVLTEDILFYNPITKKKVKLQKGSKVSKALKHFISDKEKLEKVQTLYSQILNDKFLKGTLCLSIHPMDYLTASVNDSGWTSCYDTLDKGQYCSSTLCLINSPNTVMAYLKSKDDATYGGVEWNNKKWRTFISLGEDAELAHFGRNYPYHSDALMNEARIMLQELTGKEYCELTNFTGVCQIRTPYNMYNDACGKNLTTCFTDKYEDNGIVETIVISEGPTCVKCGEIYEGIEFDLSCEDCGDYRRCAYCGDITSEEFYIESEDCCVCECCYDNNFSYCEKCGENVSNDNMVSYIHSYWENGNPHTEYMCECCAENHTDECSCCGELVKSGLLDEEDRCRDCQPAEEE